MRKMKYLLVAGAMLASCSNSQPYPIEPTNPTVSRDMVERYCPACNGLGKVKPSISQKLFIGVVTIGAGLMIEHVDCDMCGGDGIIKVRALETDSVTLR